MAAQPQPPMPSVFTPHAAPTNAGPGLPPSTFTLPASVTRPVVRPSYVQHPAPAPGVTMMLRDTLFIVFHTVWGFSVTLRVYFLSQVSCLISHSSHSLCQWVDPQLSHLQVLLCQLLIYQDLRFHLLHQPLVDCPQCPAPGCRLQASCHLPP